VKEITRLSYSEPECQEAWEKISRAGTREERIERNKGWTEYFNHLIAMQQLKEDGEIRETFEKEFPIAITEYLMREKILKPSSTVLDIGAGTGAFTLPFAANCKKVTALDMCENALNILQNRCETQELHNVEVLLDMWETFTPDKKYDVSFASMCSAICDKREILNMESVTNEYCCLVTIAYGSYAKHRMNLRKRLMEAPPAGLSSDVIYIYNLLYAMGRFPGIKYYREFQRSQMTVDEAYKTYRIYYRIFGVHGERSDEIIYDYIEENAEGGVLHDETQLNIALVYWQPHGN
jgi:SAM-dependent methyltransferase